MFMYVGPCEEHCVFSRYRATFLFLISHLPSASKNAQRTFFFPPPNSLSSIIFSLPTQNIKQYPRDAEFLLFCFYFYLFIFPPFSPRVIYDFFFCFVFQLWLCIIVTLCVTLLLFPVAVALCSHYCG